MSKSKNKQDGSRFYYQTDTLPFIGTAMLIVGILCLWLGFGMVSYILTAVFVPVGLILFFVGFSGRVSQNDLEEERDHLLRDYDESVTRMDKYDRIVLQQPAPVETAAYNMGSDAQYFKRGKGSTVISDVYAQTHFFFTRDSLMVKSRTVRLSAMDAEKGEGFTDLSATIEYAAMKSAFLDEHTTTVTLTNTSKPATVRWCELVVTGEEGELLRLPVRNDMDMSGLCDEIGRKIK